MKRYSGAASDIDMRAEVGLVSSNIVISSLDGPSTYSRGTGELFGAQVLIIGNSSARISHVAVSYGGQAGLNRAAVTFQGLKPVSGLLPLDALPNGGGGLVGLPMPPSPPPARSPPPSSTIPNPSFIAYSSVVYSMDAAVSVSGSMTSHPTTILGALSPLTSHYNADLSDLWRGLLGQGDLSDVLRQPPSSCYTGNLIYESYNAHTIDVRTPSNVIQGNLALGTIKEMADVSRQNFVVRKTREHAWVSYKS